jgi:hypothetical protein
MTDLRKAAEEALLAIDSVRISSGQEIWALLGLAQCREKLNAALAAPQDAVLAEREACAVEAEHWQSISTTPGHACGQYIAAAIRGRPRNQALAAQPQTHTFDGCGDVHSSRPTSGGIPQEQAEAVKAERERCAKVCANLAAEFAVYRDHWPQRDAALECEQAIRAGIAQPAEPVAWGCFKDGVLQTELVGTEADVDFWCRSDDSELRGMVKGALYAARSKT